MQLPTGASRFVFILAHPAGHVGAPRYYSPYFCENGLDWHMVPLDVAPAHLAETIRTLARSDSVVGFNLTMPHKPAAFALCDEPARRPCGACASPVSETWSGSTGACAS